MMKIYKTILLLLFVIIIKNLSAQVTVDATAGTFTGSYTTLKLAIDNINNGTHQGVIDIRVHANTTETASISLDSTGNSTGSNYSSILIRPADTATVVKTISTNLSGFSQFSFNGADNIEIDGRPFGLGNNKLLKFTQLGAIAASHNFNLFNGVNNFKVHFCNFSNATTTAVVTGNILLSTSALPIAANANITIQDCFIAGGRASIYLSGTAANAMDSIEIKRNELVNFANAGILSTTGSFKKLLIDSNQLYQTFNSVTAPTAIDIRHNAIGSQIIITRNRIFDMQTAITGFIRGIVLSPATVGTGTTILVANNFISLTKDGGSGANIRGFEFGGAGDVVCRFINNSIRIGGNHTLGTAGSVASMGIFKSNTSALSTWICRNNVSVNDRTGGTAGLFHTAGWVSGNGTSLVGIYDIDYNNYITTGAVNAPFPAVWNGTLYGGEAAYRAAAVSQEQHSQYVNVNFMSNTNLTLTGASINNLVNMGCPRSSFVLTDIFETTRGNPSYKGAHESTPFTNLKDAAVQEVYSLGKLPVPYANPHVVRANIKNVGIDTIFNQLVTLNISGVNSFVDNVIIDTIAPGEAKYAIFNAFNYTTVGAGTVVVSVPNDSTNSNNSKTFNQIVTSGTYAYADPTLPAAGGVGFNGIGGDFIAKFPYTGTNNINQVGVNFNTGGQPYQIVIYSVVNDTPGVLIWNSSINTAIVGVNTVNVSPAVAVTGSFFVGVRQTGTTNVGFGYQAENPIRNSVFFYKATSVANWNDFASTNSAFRFMVEPRLQVANDIGMATVTQPCAAVMQGGTAIAPEFTIINYGLNGQSSFVVHSQITGPVNMTTNDIINTFIGSGDSYTFSASSLFNPTTAGTYTVKVWTELSGDLELNNDTITYTFIVGLPTSVNNSSNALTFNGASQYLQVDGSRALNITGEKLTMEAWVNIGSLINENYIFSKNKNASQAQYSLYINTNGNLIFKVQTTLFTDSVISTNIVPIDIYFHVAAVYDGVALKLLMNGKVIGTKNLIGTITGNIDPLLIGSAFGGGGFIDGSIDEVKIWDTCRTEDQIRRNMHTRFANASNINLVAYYRLDENIGSYLIDASGNCNSAVIVNTPTFAASNFPLGTPIVFTHNASSSGILSFTNTEVSINLFNQIGSNDIYVHKFSDSALVTKPLGVTASLGKYWIINRFGSGTMDSSEITFNVAGIIPTSANTDFKLFNRINSSNASWNLSRGASNSFSYLNQSITMQVDAGLFNNQFIIGAVNTPLPVKMLSFTGVSENNNANLYWSTASEINNKGFAIERSLDGKNFKEIGFVIGAINSNKTLKYNYTDINIFNINKTAYYRLKQVDLDGKYEFSKTISITNGNTKPVQVVVYPNPVSENLLIEMEANETNNAKLIINDISGRLVKELNLNIAEGFNKFSIENLNELTDGIYFITITSNQNVYYQNKFVKVK